MSAVVRSALLRELHLPPGADGSVVVSPISVLPGCTQLVMVVALPAGAPAPLAEALLRRLLDGPLGPQMRLEMSSAGHGGAQGDGKGTRRSDGGDGPRVCAQVSGDVAAAVATAGGSSEGGGGDNGWLFFRDGEPEPWPPFQPGCWLEPAALLLPAAQAAAAGAQAQAGAGDEQIEWLELRGLELGCGGAAGRTAAAAAERLRVVVVQGDSVLVDISGAKFALKEDGEPRAVR